MSYPLRIIFAGTPVFAVKHLEAVLKSDHQVMALLTQPDKPAGRGKKLLASPVKHIAQRAGLTLWQPPTLRATAIQKQIEQLQADVIVVVAYGLLFPAALLSMARLGAINVHASLLPRWRGAAPIQRSLLAGDLQSGVTVMQMVEALDSGPILHQVTCPIGPTETSATLAERLAQTGAAALLETLHRLQQGLVIQQLQDDASATYAAKISKQEARLDWKQPALQLERAVRAFNPWPVAYFSYRGQLIKVWEAEVTCMHIPAPPKTILRADRAGIQVATPQGALNLLRLQLPGGKPMSAQDLLNAHRTRFLPGDQLE